MAALSYTGDKINSPNWPRSDAIALRMFSRRLTLLPMLT